MLLGYKFDYSYYKHNMCFVYVYYMHFKVENNLQYLFMLCHNMEGEGGITQQHSPGANY